MTSQWLGTALMILGRTPVGVVIRARKAVALAGLLTVLGMPSTSSAGLIPPELTNQDVNTLVAMEATQSALVVVALNADQPIAVQSLGTWTGTIGSSGWSLTFTGSMNGVPLSISQAGLLDLAGNDVTWTNTGIYGSTSFTGSGMYELDPSWTEFLFGAAVIGVEALNATTIVGGVAGGIVSYAVIYGESSAEGALEDVKGSTKKPTSSPSATVGSGAVPSIDSVGPHKLQDIGFQQSGTLDLTTGAASFGSSTFAVPEPSSIFLFSIGTLVLLSYGSRHLAR